MEKVVPPSPYRPLKGDKYNFDECQDKTLLDISLIYLGQDSGVNERTEEEELEEAIRVSEPYDTIPYDKIHFSFNNFHLKITIFHLIITIVWPAKPEMRNHVIRAFDYHNRLRDYRNQLRNRLCNHLVCPPLNHNRNHNQTHTSSLNHNRNHNQTHTSSLNHNRNHNQTHTVKTG